MDIVPLLGEDSSTSSDLESDLTLGVKRPSPQQGGSGEQITSGQTTSGQEINKFQVMDPMEIKIIMNMGMSSANERVNRLAAEQATRKRRVITQRKSRAMLSKARAEKAKAKVLHILEWHLMYKLIRNRMHIYEAEKLKYERNVELHKDMIEAKRDKILEQMHVNLQNVLNEEMEKQREMKRHIFEEEISLTAEATERDEKDKYENYLSKLKLDELKDDYQHEMNEYCVYWKKMAYKIWKEIEEYKLEMKKNLSFYRNQRILECLLNVESKCRKKAAESLRENVQLVEKILKLVPPKQRELSICKKENEKLERTIGQWQNIVPNVVLEMAKFVQLTFESSPERQTLLESLNELKKFRDLEPEEVEIPTKSSVSELLEDYMLAIEKEKGMDHRGKQLMKIKEKILEALSFFQETPNPKDLRGQGKSLKREKTKSCPTDFIHKMTEIIHLSKSVEEVAGSKYSLPDFENPKNFMEKRTQSLNEILIDSNHPASHRVKCT